MMYGNSMGYGSQTNPQNTFHLNSQMNSNHISQNNSSQMLRHRQNVPQSYQRSNNQYRSANSMHSQYNQENDHFLSNNTTTNPSSHHSPNKYDKSNHNKPNKYSHLPRKSIRSSGIGFVSPIPQKYQENLNKENGNIQRLDITKPNGSLIINEQSMPISPIKSTLRHNEFQTDNTLQLNTTNNTLNFSNVGATTIATHNRYGNESRLSVQQVNQDINIQNERQIAIIGFPAGIGSIQICLFS